MEIKKIVIVGMGALGTLYGHYFTQKLGKDKVSFVLNKDRYERYSKNMIECNGEMCDFGLISEDENDQPADLVIFAVKATALDEALETAKNIIGENTVILSVLNGISSEDIIGKRFGMSHIVYCVAEGMDAVKMGSSLTYSKLGQLRIGLPESLNQNTDKLNAVSDLFEKINLPFTIDMDIMRGLWSKFMLNVGVNQTVMVYEGTYKTIQLPGEARELMLGAMREVLNLSKYEGINVTEEDMTYYLKLVDSLSPSGMPSMRQDGLGHKRSEVELFSGTILKLAKKHDLKVPINEKLYNLIKDIESSYIDK